MKTKRERDIKRVFQQIAQREGVSVQEVRQEIEKAIEYARQGADPKAQAFWKSVPCKGEYPTPEEAIIHIAGTVAQRQKRGIKKTGYLPS